MSNSNRGRFVWHEYLAKDPKAAIAFYTETLGWKTQPFGDGGYTMWVSAQGPLGGVYPLPEAAAQMGAPPHWMAHVEVDDVDKVAALAKKLGGKVYKEPADMPTVGRFAVIADPQGASIAIFKPLKPMTLHETGKEGEFCWNELFSSDSVAGLAFYTELFGWKAGQEFDMGPKGTYRFFTAGDQPVGGALTIPADMPQMKSSWVYYTETSDIDAAIGRAKKNGGKVMNGPVEVPGGGRIAQLIDPQGGFFALHQSPKK